MNDKLFQLLEKLPRKNLINLMWSSLDLMQGSNTRSRMDCIMASINANPSEEPENGNRTFYKIPSLKEIKKTTNTSF